MRVERLWVVFFLTAFVWIGFASGQGGSPEKEVEAKIWAAMSKCWATIDDLPDPGRLTVAVFMTLREDGTLAGEPIIVSPENIDPNDEAMKTSAARAIRATKKCAPYDFPKEHYELWQNITMRFRSNEEPVAIS